MNSYIEPKLRHTAWIAVVERHSAAVEPLRGYEVGCFRIENSCRDAKHSAPGFVLHCTALYHASMYYP